jgi:hypothetical protein
MNLATSLSTLQVSVSCGKLTAVLQPVDLAVGLGWILELAERHLEGLKGCAGAGEGVRYRGTERDENCG